MLVISNRKFFDSYISEEGVPSVAGVLGDLEALGLLSQRGTVTGTVLADNADLYKVNKSQLAHDHGINLSRISVFAGRTGSALGHCIDDGG